MARQSLSAYRDALTQRNAARYGGGGGNSYSAPSAAGVNTGGNSSVSVPTVTRTQTVTNAFNAPTGARITDGGGNSLKTPQNAYAQALAGGGVLENPFPQSYGYIQSLMNGTANGADNDGWLYNPATEAYTRYPETPTTPSGGYADTVQENANRIVSPVYNPATAARWNYDVPETVRMQSGGQLSPAAEAYSGMVNAVNSDADIAMAGYWADIANTAQSEIDRQYALRQALRYRNRII